MNKYRIKENELFNHEANWRKTEKQHNIIKQISHSYVKYNNGKLPINGYDEQKATKIKSPCTESCRDSAYHTRLDSSVVSAPHSISGGR